jgi:hypothetical protein
MTLNQSDFTQLNRGVDGDKMATTTDGVLKVQKTHPIFFDTLLNINRPVEGYSNSGRFPVEDIKHTDFEGVIGQNVNDAYTLENPRASSALGFHLVVPTGGTVEFEGSYDNINWVSTTYRQIGADGFRSHAHFNEDFTGSIAGFRSIRWRVSIAGSAPGSVAGRIVDPPSTIEGIEHGNPPHNIGVRIVRFGVNITGAVTSQVLYTPTSVIHPRRFNITSYALAISESGSIRIYDEVDSSDNWIFAAEVKSNDNSQFSNASFSPPFVSSAAGNRVRITTTGNVVVTGVFTGYEVCG